MEITSISQCILNQSVSSISGNIVSISGTATIAGAVTTSVSGNYINYSGILPASVSGNVDHTSISGNVVAI